MILFGPTVLTIISIVVGLTIVVTIGMFYWYWIIILPGKITFETLADHFGGECVDIGLFDFPKVFFTHDQFRFRIESAKINKDSEYAELGLKITAWWPDPTFRMNVCRKTIFSRFHQSFSGLKVASVEDKSFNSRLTVFLKKESDAEQVLTVPMRASFLRMLESQSGIERTTDKPGNNKPRKKKAFANQKFNLDIIAGRITLECAIDFRKTDYALNLVEDFCDFYFMAIEVTKPRNSEKTI